MKFTCVEMVPEVEKSKPKNKICIFLEEFMTANQKFALVEFKEGEYKHPDYPYKVLWMAVRRDGYPIQVVKRKDKVYLIRKDM